MKQTALSVLLGLILACLPAPSQAPASTAGQLEAVNPISQIEASVQPQTDAELDLILPLAGPSIHTDYSGSEASYVWKDLNSANYSAYGVKDGRFIYQPGDTWFVYGVFGPIEAVKYNWNVKYTNWDGRHNGIDFAAPVGLPVLSASGGKVIFAGERAGHTVIVQTGEFQIIYSHLNSFTVKIGERVTQRQTIGYTGSSGTTNSHLHFEIDRYKNGERWGINPMKYLLPELQAAVVPDVPTNRCINEPLVWNLADDFPW